MAVVAWGMALTVLLRNERAVGAIQDGIGAAAPAASVVLISGALALLVIALAGVRVVERVPGGVAEAYLVLVVIVMLLVGLLAVDLITVETGAGIMVTSGWVFAVPAFVELARAQRAR